MCSPGIGRNVGPRGNTLFFMDRGSASIHGRSSLPSSIPSEAALEVGHVLAH